MSEILGFEKWANAALSVAGTNGMSDDQVIPTWPEGVDGPELTIGMVKAALGANGGEKELLPSVREYLQQGIYDATHCEDADQDHAFAKQLHHILNYPAPPSVAVPDGVNFDLISAVLEDYANLQTSGAIPCANRYPASDANEQAKLLDALTAAPQPDHSGDANKVVEPFQTRVSGWMQECFGPEISADKVERNHRFLEEALELVQSLGCTKEEASQLVDYVYGRAVGDPPQEVGGVMVTLAALCLASGMDMDAAAETELARILQPEVVAKIREKQKRKPAFSPLPGSYPEREQAQEAGRQVKPHRTGKSSGPFIPESGAGIIATEDPIARLRSGDDGEGGAL